MDEFIKNTSSRKQTFIKIFYLFHHLIEIVRSAENKLLLKK